MDTSRSSFSLHDVMPLASIDQLRDLMPVTQRCVYLDHAALSPIPQPTADAMQAWADDALYSGGLHWKYWQTRIRQTRELAAALLGAVPEDVAFVPSTSAGIAVVAEGFPWQPGDNVVVPLAEFPSNLYPWMNLASRGVEVRKVQSNGSHSEALSDAIASACDSHTKVVACSWVDFVSGERRDLMRISEIAHRHQALFVVDAIQGLGVLELNVVESGVDVLVADGRKWLLAADGVGILYAQRDRTDRLRVLGPGWNSVVNPTDFDSKELQLKSDATRFETGILNTCGIAALYASLKLLSAIPLVDRETRLLEVRRQLLEAANSAGLHADNLPTLRQSGILSLDCGQRDPDTTARNMRKQGIVVSVRGGRLRISPHIYNDHEDVQQFAKQCQQSR